MKLNCRMAEKNNTFKAVPQDSTKSFQTALRLSDDELRATLTQSAETLVMGVSDNSGAFPLEMSGTTYVTKLIGGEIYDGAYEVTPSFEGQTLPTATKVMAHDVTVDPITVSSVSNTSGGNTVYIGGIF